MADDESYRKAKKRVNEIRGFYTHLMIFVLINLALALLNYFTSPGVYWFYWVTIFWGIGLCIHAYQTFSAPRILGDEWEEKKIKEIMEKQKK